MTKRDSDISKIKLINAKQNKDSSKNKESRETLSPAEVSWMTFVNLFIYSYIHSSIYFIDKVFCCSLIHMFFCPIVLTFIYLLIIYYHCYFWSTFLIVIISFWPYIATFFTRLISCLLSYIFIFSPSFLPQYFSLFCLCIHHWKW